MCKTHFQRVILKEYIESANTLPFPNHFQMVSIETFSSQM